MGSSITKNNLNSKYIEEFTDFQVPNWDFVRKCMNLKSTKYCYNWIEALYAAVEFIKQNVYVNILYIIYYFIIIYVYFNNNYDFLF